MKMFSGRMHWLTVGLALLVSAQLGTQLASAQAPMPGGPGYGMPPGSAMPGMGVMPAGGMRMPDAPMSMSFEGPAPMEVMYASGHSSCDSGCDSMGGCDGCGGCNSCGGSACGGMGCGILGGGGLLARGGRGCMSCGGAGCGACGGAGILARLLGPLAPYSEGGRGAQRWYDVYVGTIALARTSDFGGIATGERAPDGQFLTTTLISTDGVGQNTPVIRSTDLDLNRLRYGLEAIANLQTGVGSNLEARYFGLNNWQVGKTVNVVGLNNGPTLYSIFSDFGDSPPGGFDDTDRSFIHSVTYNSEIHNGEVNYRRRWVGAGGFTQGSWLGGLRYFDLDERFGFSATGSNNNTFSFDQLRFFNYDTRTRNQLTGVQIGSDLWLNLMPGFQIGVEGKTGIFGNHAEVESQIVANSVPGAREFLQDGKTAFLTELTASVVYRLTYSWSVRGGYNFMYVDNVALAPENFNTRDFGNALGAANAFTGNRAPFLNVDGEVVYQGFSVGAEWLY